MEMPSQKEQRIAERYVLEHKLERPDTDAKKAVKCFCIFMIMSFLFAVLSFHLFQWLGIFTSLPNSFIQFQNRHPAIFKIFYYIIFIAIMGLFVLKKAVIGAIKLYQHYTSEDIRRRCLFKPTCSEYAILAIKKYGVIVGLIKAYNRLFRKCKGNIYRIDYP